MKTKNIYEIAIKIAGIVAAWNFIESLILFGIMIVTFSSIPTFGVMSFFAMAPINNMSIYLIVAYALFAFILLFRTEKVMQWLKLNNQEDADLNIERKVLYHVLVLVCGFCMFIYSANHIATKTYSSNENTSNTITKQPITKTTNINPTTSPINMNVRVSSSSSKTTITCYDSTSKTTSTNNSNTTNYNYISMLLLLVSLLIIFKSVRISEFFMPKVAKQIY